ncbi:MAG: single-stranded DNA-binding protein [candidate division WOR-3 bacterium]
MANLRLGYLNLVLFMGRLTADPELKYTQKGAPVCTFRVASTRRFKDRETNELKEETTYVNVVTWRRLAERVNDYLKKGSAVLIEGRLNSRSWETNEGQKRSIVEIVAYRVQFLDRMEVEGGAESPGEVSEIIEEDTGKDEIEDNTPF